MTITDTTTSHPPARAAALPEVDAFSRHGAYLRTTLRDALGAEGVRAAVETGRLTGFGRGVLLDAQRLLDLRTRAAGALLLAGPTAVLVGPTAAALHGCPVLGGFAVHVRVPHYQRTRGRPGMIVHQGDLRAIDIGLVDGLPVLCLPTALAEVLCGAARRAALAAVDQALHPLAEPGRTALTAEIGAALDRRPDRRGSSRALALLGLATGRPASVEESALLLAAVDAGLPVPISRYEVPGTGPALTLAWPESRIGVRYRRTGDDLAAAREHGLNRPDWQVIAADETDLADPTWLCRRLRTHLGRQPVAA